MINGDHFDSTQSKKPEKQDKEKHIPLAELMRPKVA